MITGHRDTDYLVTTKLRDADLLNLCCAVPHLEVYQSDDFWKNRFLTRYGSIQKSPNKSWKTVYLQMKYYRSRVYEAALHGHLDLVDFFYCKGKIKPKLALQFAASGCHLDLIDYLIGKGGKDYSCDWNDGMYGAAQGGHRTLFDDFITRGGKDYGWDWRGGMIAAAQGGHLDLVKYFIDKGVKDYDTALFFAEKGGHRDVADFLISKGARKQILL